MSIIDSCCARYQYDKYFELSNGQLNFKSENISGPSQNKYILGLLCFFLFFTNSMVLFVRDNNIYFITNTNIDLILNGLAWLFCRTIWYYSKWRAALILLNRNRTLCVHPRLSFSHYLFTHLHNQQLFGF